MSFNPDPTKPAEEILFSQKVSETHHPPLYFNGIEVKRVSEHKHLGFPDYCDFIYHIPELGTKERSLESGRMTDIRLNYQMEKLESL